MRYVVTGGAGFIGSNLVRHLLAQGHHVVNFDLLTYAAHPLSLTDLAGNDRYTLVQGDVADEMAVATLLQEFRPQGIFHLAAESHVDRSIDGPAAFIRTNVMGTFTMLERTRAWWTALPEAEKTAFRFLHVSTDEVFGSIEGPPADEAFPYRPSSPYSASKAGSDHLARAWFHTYGMPVLVTNCSNNYGPCQFPEKLIPHMILCALEGRELPVYGNGENVRDWLHVEDHARALAMVMEGGRVGETYNVSGRCERRNIDVVRGICAVLDRLAPAGAPHDRLIRFVTDRPGHDFRYALDSSRLGAELDWHPAHDFETGLAATVEWYLDNRDWWRPLRSGHYDGRRLGLENAAP